MRVYNKVSKIILSWIIFNIDLNNNSKYLNKNFKNWSKKRFRVNNN